MLRVASLIVFIVVIVGLAVYYLIRRFGSRGQGPKES
jgi:hypothetical protein